MYLEKMLHDLSDKKNKLSLYLPGLWLDHKTPSPIKIDYPTFISSRIEEILNQKNQRKHTPLPDWTEMPSFTICSSGFFQPMITIRME